NEELLELHKSADIPDSDVPPGVPHEVRAFVARLMAKRPWQRYEFAGDARRVWRAFRPESDASSTPIPRGALSVDPKRPTRDEITLRDSLVDGGAGPPGTIATGLLGLRPTPLVARQPEQLRLLEAAADVVGRTVAPAGSKPPAPHRFILLE